jgi:hypothetical protein
MSELIQPGELFICRIYDTGRACWSDWKGPASASFPVAVGVGSKGTFWSGGATTEVRRATPEALAEAGIGTVADKPRQVRLTRSQVVSTRKAAKHFRKVFQNIPTPQGVKHWEHIYNHLIAMADHGTSDGEPFGDSEQLEPRSGLSPEAAAAARKTASEIKAEADRYEMHRAKVWKELSVLLLTPGGSEAIADQDRVPTDEDAKTRPLCMYRDSEKNRWDGPWALIHVNDRYAAPFRDEQGTVWFYCRFATKEEVEASNGR